MTLRCPQCNRENIRSNDYARRVTSSLGAFVGAAFGMSGAATGARGNPISELIPPSTRKSAGCVAGALLSGMVCGKIGGVAGAKLGTMIDDNILRNYECLACGYWCKSARRIS
jgi:uncharacterized membrane protein